MRDKLLPESGRVEVAVDEAPSSPPRISLFHPIGLGMLAAVVGFASAFAIVLQGLAAAGASPAEIASGLMILTVTQGLMSVWLSYRYRMPITAAWSTPGAVLLVATGVPEGGYPAVVGAFVASSLLMIAAGLWRPFGRLVASIPLPLAGAMLAGVLLDLCLAPMRAVGAMPELALPIVIVWAVALRFARLYAVPLAVLVTAVLVVTATPVPPDALAHPIAYPVWVAPVFSLDAAIGIALPLFVVTMASQNVPGLAVLNANGYRPAAGPLFTWTGAAGLASAPLGGIAINLSAIAAALCAAPEAHPDPGRRWIAATAAGTTYLFIGPLSGIAAAFVAASPPLLIQAVAGLALLGSLGSAMTTALSREEDRLPAVLTFVTAASGLSLFGIGAAFWGLVAGGAVYALMRLKLGHHPVTFP